MRRSNEARISAVVMVGSMRALTEPMLPAEAACPAFSCCGGVSEMKFSLRAGLVMGGFSIFGLSLGVVFLGVPDLMNSASSSVRMSLKVLRRATGHFLQQLLHFVRGEECGRAHCRNDLRLPCGIGEGLALRKTGSHEFRFAKR